MGNQTIKIDMEVEHWLKTLITDDVVNRVYSNESSPISSPEDVMERLRRIELFSSNDPIFQIRRYTTQKERNWAYQYIFDKIQMYKGVSEQGQQVLRDL